MTVGNGAEAEIVAMLDEQGRMVLARKLGFISPSALDMSPKVAYSRLQTSSKPSPWRPEEADGCEYLRMLLLGQFGPQHTSEPGIEYIIHS